MITDEKMEKLIAELYEESIQEMEVSVDIDVEAHLDRAYRELEAKEKEEAAAARKKKFKSVIRAAVVFIGILVVSLVAFEPEQGYADVFRFMFDRDARGNEVISDNLIGNEADSYVEYIETDIEKIDETVGRHIPLPTYLPEGYEMIPEIKITKGYDKIFSLYISYIENENWQMIIYNVVPITEKSAHSAILDMSEEKKEQLYVDNIFYEVYRDEENEKTYIYWEIDEYIYSIDGNLNQEEAIKIIESIE